MKKIKKLFELLFRRVKKNDAGIWGEKEAAKYLRNKKYSILGQRVRISRRDEIDIIATTDEMVVFVEVKTRSSEEYGRPADSVKKIKKHVLSRAAVRYLKKMKSRSSYIRFDVIEVVGSPKEGVREVRHIENAFQLQKPYNLPY